MLVGYYQCPVPQATFSNNTCNITGKTTGWVQAVDSKCGIPVSSTRVIIGGNLVDPQLGCTGETLGVYDANLGGNIFISQLGYRFERFVLAHEIGHRLGLQHQSSNDFPHNLMISQADNEGPDLTGTQGDVPQCDIAYAKAAQLHNDYW
jgi:Metallo-peptidase family M12B Reprolysin-like